MNNTLELCEIIKKQAIGTTPQEMHENILVAHNRQKNVFIFEEKYKNVLLMEGG